MTEAGSRWRQRLEDRGWEPESGGKRRWVDHTFQNDEATLEVRYLPKVDLLRFDFTSEECFSQLTLSFTDSPDQLLDLVFDHQSSLSRDTWPAFVASLIEVSPRVVSLADADGEYDGEETVITDLDQGVAALREIEWE